MFLYLPLCPPLGIYSNVMGYLGGVNWAILVTRVTQLYPFADAFTIVSKFFSVYRHWNWENPVCLNVAARKNDKLQAGFGIINLDVWDPKMNEKRDGSYSMAVITPAYPAMNSTFNVSPSTLRNIYTHICQADEECTNLLAMDPANVNWSETLFAPSTFFTDFRYYIEGMFDSHMYEERTSSSAE